MKIIRVFPRRTSATPDDELVVVGRTPQLFDQADEIHISVSFTWDIPKAEYLAREWEIVAPVKVGGPAYKDPGGEFIPGRYVKKGYTITSRGCPNNCWFCSAWKNEGRRIRELQIQEGYNLLDNNILACSLAHRGEVYAMLKKQKNRPRFTGGLEAARMTAWDADQIIELNPYSFYFAYDTENDWEPLIMAANMLQDRGAFRKYHNMVGCYVLIGYPGDTIDKAQQRLSATARLGFYPQAMLFNRDEKGRQTKEWTKFTRLWANKYHTHYQVKKSREL